MVERGDERGGVRRGEIRHRRGRETPRLDAPDPAACFVAFRVGPRHLVVGDDFVIPIDNVEVPIRAETHGDGAK